MVIVTQNQYLLASKIHHIVMDEVTNFIDIRDKNGRQRSFKDQHYVIQIIYSPENVNSQNNGTIRNSDEQRECSVTIRSAVNAHKVFRDLIQQIREQMPDQLYLDTALERMIAASDVSSLAERDADDEDNQLLFDLQVKEKRNDRKPKKIRKPRKTKGRNQKVLRKSK